MKTEQDKIINTCLCDFLYKINSGIMSFNDLNKHCLMEILDNNFKVEKCLKEKDCFNCISNFLNQKI